MRLAVLLTTFVPEDVPAPQIRWFSSEIARSINLLACLLTFTYIFLEDVTSSQSEYTFRRQLKAWLFKKSFPDIII